MSVTITLPTPFSGETFKIKASDAPVVVYGADHPRVVNVGCAAVFKVVHAEALDEDGEPILKWEQVDGNDEGRNSESPAAR